MTESMTSQPALELLGWDASFERAFRRIARDGQVPARVIEQRRDRWLLAAAAGEHVATPASRLRAAGGLPAVGDWVVAEPVAGAAHTRIVDVVPRRGAFVRRAPGGGAVEQVIAANVDVALVLTALPTDLSPRRLERYVTLAWDGGALPVIVLTKADLAADLAAAVATASAAAPGVGVLAVSAVTGQGITAVRDRVAARRTAVLLGSSGVGKSTLLNRLLGADRLRTGPVRADGRGRHTTTHRALVRTPWGALVIDTPGLREVGLHAGTASLDDTFADIDELGAGCRFRDCAHATEPGCAVLAAVDAGTLDGARLAAWQRLGRELRWLERQTDPRAAAEATAERRAVHRAYRKAMRRKQGTGRADG